jgi:hypothetical protein
MKNAPPLQQHPPRRVGDALEHDERAVLPQVQQPPLLAEHRRCRAEHANELGAELHARADHRRTVGMHDVERALRGDSGAQREEVWLANRHVDRLHQRNQLRVDREVD